MANTDQDIGTASDPYFEGDSLDVTVTVTEDGSAKDLSGASVSWAMEKARSGNSDVLTDSDSGVSVSISDAAAGEITLTLADGVTDGLIGVYTHEFRVTSASGDKAVVTRGHMNIERRATP